jgi:hypothetical protein
MRITDPVALCGTPDVIWIRGDGMLVVGDYKSRENRQAYDSDIIQLSVYRLLLQRTQKKPVANYGFVHFRNGGGRALVKLMSAKEVIALYHRYLNVIDKKCNSCIAGNRNYCRYCSHQHEC